MESPAPFRGLRRNLSESQPQGNSVSMSKTELNVNNKPPGIRRESSINRSVRDSSIDAFGNSAQYDRSKGIMGHAQRVAVPTKHTREMSISRASTSGQINQDPIMAASVSKRGRVSGAPRRVSGAALVAEKLRQRDEELRKHAAIVQQRGDDIHRIGDVIAQRLTRAAARRSNVHVPELFQKVSSFYENGDNHCRVETLSESLRQSQLKKRRDLKLEEYLQGMQRGRRQLNDVLVMAENFKQSRHI